MHLPRLVALLVAVSAGNAFAAAPRAGAFSSPARSVRTPHWWDGLDAPTEHAEARGVHTMMPSLAGRVRVMGGLFRMGSTPIDMIRALVMCRKETLGTVCDELQNVFRAEGHAHEVTLLAYELDRVEVTVAAYARCVEAGPCAPAGYTPGDPRFDRPNLPVTYVRWEDAATFCAWNGGRLPTEAEWEFAARGTELRDFPWGFVYNPHLANHGSLAHDETDATDGFVGLAPVGSFPDGATPLGILDMAGNAGEWVNDFFDQNDSNFGYEARAQVNPQGPPSGVGHVIRGGSYAEGAPWMRGAAREWMFLSRSPSVGFRCAYDERPNR